MPVDLFHMAVGLMFLAVWAMAGQILVREH